MYVRESADYTTHRDTRFLRRFWMLIANWIEGWRSYFYCEWFWFIWKIIILFRFDILLICVPNHLPSQINFLLKDDASGSANYLGKLCFRCQFLHKVSHRMYSWKVALHFGINIYHSSKVFDMVTRYLDAGPCRVIKLNKCCWVLIFPKSFGINEYFGCFTLITYTWQMPGAT